MCIASDPDSIKNVPPPMMKIKRKSIFKYRGHLDYMDSDDD